MRQTEKRFRSLDREQQIQLLGILKFAVKPRAEDFGRDHIKRFRTTARFDCGVVPISTGTNVFWEVIKTKYGQYDGTGMSAAGAHKQAVEKAITD